MSLLTSEYALLSFEGLLAYRVRTIEDEPDGSNYGYGHVTWVPS